MIVRNVRYKTLKAYFDSELLSTHNLEIEEEEIDLWVNSELFVRGCSVC